MKPLRLLRWSGAVLSPRTRPYPLGSCCLRQYHVSPIQHQSTASSPLQEPWSTDDPSESHEQSPSQLTPETQSDPTGRESDLHKFPSPSPSQALKSAKLAALHARLSLSPRLPLETLARCLIDSTADPNPAFNNSSLALLGSSLIGYYTSEAILCRYPRLPTEVVFAAMWAYSGPKTLGIICREWGVEVVAEPGSEVDPGLLQCRRLETNDLSGETLLPVKEVETVRPNAGKGWRVGINSRTMYDNAFGEEIPRTDPSLSDEKKALAEDLKAGRVISLIDACSKFIHALLAGIYLHQGRRAAKFFFNEHILSRHLDVPRLFEFTVPTRDLAKLCVREGFPQPVARILSETGRLSRSPVFVVGVFAGKEKLGEGQGASLNEARTRAAVAALKGWYLYSPIEVRVPSDAEGGGKRWEPVLVDMGEVVI
ncbi:MAG: hypothetical protein Q9191_003370 [Dirinaria sp. TL-2023a]